MTQSVIYPLGRTEACAHASKVLSLQGVPIAHVPGGDVTHLLLDVPSFRPDPHPDLSDVLTALPRNITVIGGNLNHSLLDNHAKTDLLQDEDYIAQNAAITAHCALTVAVPLLKTTLADTPTIILGWGRIGKCLARLLKGLGCPVSVAARQERDRSMLRAMGYPAYHPAAVPLQEFQLLFNTVPAPVLCAAQLNGFPKLVKIELASTAGLSGEDIHMARGLPGIIAPESSGTLIAQTVLRKMKEELL